MEDKGLIFDIQHFAVHDGPGIRTLVFFKGCNFKCPWCENPEGINPFPEIMYLPKRCIGEFECVNKCTQGAIIKNEDNKDHKRVEILWDRCTNCLDCAGICYPGAIKSAGKWVTVEEVLKEIMDDEHLYGDRGGVTLSGGEPTLQKDFVITLLKQCRKMGIDTAIETNGSIESERDFLAIAEQVDHMLMDIKHINSEVHKKFTGFNNKNTLRNFKLAIDNCPHVVARVPVIPDFNMNDGDILDIDHFVKDSGGKEIHLLPYHSLGASKSENLGRPYEYQIKKSVRFEDIVIFKNLIKERYGLVVKMGG